MKFPWSKPKLSPTQEALSSMRTSMINDLQTQLVNGFSLPCLDISNQVCNAVTTMFGGIKVKTVKADPQLEKDEQDSQFNGLMAALNGDRDIVHPTPENIEIKTFVNDGVPREQREDIVKILDIINEACDINRDDVYRDEIPETPVQQPETPNTQPSINLMAPIMAMLQPMLQLMMTVCSYVVAITVMTRVCNILERV